MWDFIFEIIGSFTGRNTRSENDFSRVGESEFERESRHYWAKWAFGLALAGLAAYGLWSLWAGN